MHEISPTETQSLYEENERQELKAACQKTYEEVMEFFKDFNYNVSTSCRHTLSNLTSIMHPKYFDPLKENDSILSEMKQCLEGINEYYRLLDLYPEFAKKELSEGHGYFDPSRLRSIEGGAKAQIAAYNEWLSQEFASSDKKE